jgi:hypothetical protein
VSYCEHDKEKVVRPEHLLAAVTSRMLWGTGRLQLPFKGVHPYQPSGPDENYRGLGGFGYEFAVRLAEERGEIAVRKASKGLSKRGAAVPKSTLPAPNPPSSSKKVAESTMLDFFLKTAKDIFYFFLSAFIATNLNAGSEERSKNRIDAVAETEEKSSTNWGKVERAKYTFINDAESVEEYEIALAEQKAHEAKRKEDETQKTEEEIEQRDAEYQKFEAERIAEGAPPFTENQKKDRRLQCKSLDLVHRMQKKYCEGDTANPFIPSGIGYRARL